MTKKLLRAGSGGVVRDGSSPPQPPTGETSAPAKTAPTPGPWSVFGEPIDRHYGIEADEAKFSVVVFGDADDEDMGVQGRTRDEMLANARLIAAAPDHALYGRAITARLIRWEPFLVGVNSGGELCCNGLRYSTTLDDFGVPRLPAALRAFLTKAEGR